MKNNKFESNLKKNYNIPKNSKIVYYKNPKGYRISFIENINPKHKKIVYGKKRNIKNSCEKIAKIIIPSLFLIEIGLLSTFALIYSLLVFSNYIVLCIFFHKEMKIFLTDINKFILKVYDFYGVSRKYSCWINRQ
jgi:hypothetical protein